MTGFYFAITPGDAPMKLHAQISAFVLLRRAIGVGATAPFREISKDVWIVVRVFLDYVTDAGGPIDVRYWESCLSLIWPIWWGVRY